MGKTVAPTPLAVPGRGTARTRRRLGPAGRRSTGLSGADQGGSPVDVVDVVLVVAVLLAREGDVESGAFPGEEHSHYEDDIDDIYR